MIAEVENRYYVHWITLKMLQSYAMVHVITYVRMMLHFTEKSLQKYKCIEYIVS